MSAEPGQLMFLIFRDAAFGATRFAGTFSNGMAKAVAPTPAQSAIARAGAVKFGHFNIAIS
jgi:hypothetical protein